MEEKIQELISKAIFKVDGKTFYKSEVIQQINALGVYLTFTNEGVRYHL